MQEIEIDVLFPLENAAAEVVVGLQSPGSCPGVSPFKTPCTSKVNDSILGGTFVRWEESTLPWWVLFTVLLVFTAGMHEIVEKGVCLLLFFYNNKKKSCLKSICSSLVLDEVEKQSTCELEVDAVAADILNHIEIQSKLWS